MVQIRQFARNEHFFKQRNNIYLACEEMDFTWNEKEIKQVEIMWNKGVEVHSIATEMKRDPDEVVILIIDRAKKGCIGNRPGGLIGTEVLQK
ncbi:helix-turn-helix domain-containing protein [Paenibacillus gallinarum]|uniref:Helix-turn-helix domain-containing protein n=1 Tax=Paenibacillus gallinarum TaxID=2762232 RepID=A0ABR8SW40_9BACL|nr:helix-turn-helix domain-containing protein [Paenibacillus gallinarum]MBD7967726.1 helix-turn-helix domain-containing protein [Paenibacillus gallinarum]